MSARQLKEYWLTLNFQVQAHDEEEAAEIGRALLQAAKSNVPWKVLDGQLETIEEA